MAWANRTKNTNTYRNLIKWGAELTWADIGGYTWEELKNITWAQFAATSWSKRSKNTTAHTNQTKN